MRHACFLLLLIFTTLSYTLYAAEKGDQKKPSLHQCQMKTYDEPKAGTVTGYDHADCVQIEEGIRICKVAGPEEDDKENAFSAFVIEQDGKRLTSWPTDTFLGETYDFEVLKKDLDGDHQEELIIASRNGQTCGMAIEDWTIAILDGKSIFQQPLIFNVQDYGGDEFIQQEKSDGCLIMAAEWQSMVDPKRGEGYYFVGRFFRYRSEALEKAEGFPILARRFLNSFQSERSVNRAPLQWINNATTKIMQIDPYLFYLKKISDKPGKIEKITRNGTTFETSFVIKYDSGENEEFAYGLEYDYPYCMNEQAICRLGEAKSGIIYPFNYAPPNIEQTFAGKEVIISRYCDDTDHIWHYEEKVCTNKENNQEIYMILWFQ